MGDTQREFGQQTERRHVVTGPYRESTWPSQWIAMCSCGRGIRCNDQDAAYSFLEEGGCI